MILSEKNGQPDFSELFGVEKFNDIPPERQNYLKGWRSVEGGFEVDLHEIPVTEACELVLEGATALREKVLAAKYKIEIILHRMELLTTVQGMIDQADVEIQIAWNHTKNIRRDSPTVATFAQALSLSDEDVDELFYEANQITI